MWVPVADKGMHAPVRIKASNIDGKITERHIATPFVRCIS